VGDFNGDAKPDLAVANENPSNVSILLGNGNGTFQAAANFGVGSQPTSVVVGDFNGDGTLDLAVGNEASTNVSILLGKGDGTFLAPDNYGAGGGPVSIATGDFNGDGKPDLAVANWFAGNVSILLATAGSPVIPESPSVILLPLMGIVAAGLVLIRERRARLGQRIG
jgi:hypothetical protein